MIFDYTLGIVLLGIILISINMSIIGVYNFLRNQSLIGDVVAHSSLPGLYFAFIITGSYAPPVLFVGAILSSFLGHYLFISILEYSTIKEDGALGVVIGFFFGIGMFAYTYAQNIYDFSKAGLTKFLLGQASALLIEDVYWIVIISSILLSIIFINRRPLKVLIFNPEYGETIGISYKKIDFIFNLLLILTIVISLQAIGAVLITSLLTIPAAAARQWTQNLRVMIFLSIFITLISSISGVFTSMLFNNIATGPIIVCYLILFFSISLSVKLIKTKAFKV